MTCRRRAVVPTTLPSYSTDMEHDGRKYHIEIPDFAVLQCDNCGSLALDDEANDRLFEALRFAAGLLSPAEIRRQREALSLKQRELANLLQISDSTLSRWETGAQMQQRCMDTFLRGFFAVEELRRFLSMTNSALSASNQPAPPLPEDLEGGFSSSTEGWPESMEMDPIPSSKSTDSPKKVAAC